MLDSTPVKITSLSMPTSNVTSSATGINNSKCKVKPRKFEFNFFLKYILVAIALFFCGTYFVCLHDISYLLFLYFQVAQKFPPECRAAHVLLLSLLPNTICEMSTQSYPDGVLMGVVRSTVRRPHLPESGRFKPGVNHENESLVNTSIRVSRERSSEARVNERVWGKKFQCQKFV